MYFQPILFLSIFYLIQSLVSGQDYDFHPQRDTRYPLNTERSAGQTVLAQFDGIEDNVPPNFTNGPGIESDCGNRDISQCTELLEVLTRKDIGFATTRRELRDMCPVLMNGLQCIDNYTIRCLNPQHRQYFNELYAGTTKVIKDLCNSNGLYQEEYIRHAPCMRRVHPKYNKCSEVYHSKTARLNEVNSAVVKLSEADRKRNVITLCCSFQEYLQCSERIVFETCGNDTATFTKEFLNRMAGSIVRNSLTTKKYFKFENCPNFELSLGNEINEKLCKVDVSGNINLKLKEQKSFSNSINKKSMNLKPSIKLSPFYFLPRMENTSAQYEKQIKKKTYGTFFRYKEMFVPEILENDLSRNINRDITIAPTENMLQKLSLKNYLNQSRIITKYKISSDYLSKNQLNSKQRRSVTTTTTASEVPLISVLPTESTKVIKRKSPFANFFAKSFIAVAKTFGKYSVSKSRQMNENFTIINNVNPGLPNSVNDSDVIAMTFPELETTNLTGLNEVKLNSTEHLETILTNKEDNFNNSNIDKNSEETGIEAPMENSSLNFSFYPQGKPKNHYDSNKMFNISKKIQLLIQSQIESTIIPLPKLKSYPDVQVEKQAKEKYRIEQVFSPLILSAPEAIFVSGYEPFSNKRNDNRKHNSSVYQTDEEAQLEIFHMNTTINHNISVFENMSAHDSNISAASDSKISEPDDLNSASNDSIITSLDESIFLEPDLSSLNYSIILAPDYSNSSPLNYLRTLADANISATPINSTTFNLNISGLSISSVLNESDLDYLNNSALNNSGILADIDKNVSLPTNSNISSHGDSYISTFEDSSYSATKLSNFSVPESSNSSEFDDSNTMPVHNASNLSLEKVKVSTSDYSNISVSGDSGNSSLDYSNIPLHEESDYSYNSSLDYFNIPLPEDSNDSGFDYINISTNATSSISESEMKNNSKFFNSTFSATENSENLALNKLNIPVDNNSNLIMPDYTNKSKSYLINSSRSDSLRISGHLNSNSSASEDSIDLLGADSDSLGNYLNHDMKLNIEHQNLDSFINNSYKSGTLVDNLHSTTLPNKYAYPEYTVPSSSAKENFEFDNDTDSLFTISNERAEDVKQMQTKMDINEKSSSSHKVKDFKIQPTPKKVPSTTIMQPSLVGQTILQNSEEIITSKIQNSSKLREVHDDSNAFEDIKNKGNQLKENYDLGLRSGHPLNAPNFNFVAMTVLFLQLKRY